LGGSRNDRQGDEQGEGAERQDRIGLVRTQGDKQHTEDAMRAFPTKRNEEKRFHAENRSHASK
jgi:hypothetical protein